MKPPIFYGVQVLWNIVQSWHPSELEPAFCPNDSPVRHELNAAAFYPASKPYIQGGVNLVN